MDDVQQWTKEEEDRFFYVLEWREHRRRQRFWFVSTIALAVILAATWLFG